MCDTPPEMRENFPASARLRLGRPHGQVSSTDIRADARITSHLGSQRSVVHGGQAGLKAGSLPRLAAKTGGPTQREQNFGAAVDILSKPVNITLRCRSIGRPRPAVQVVWMDSDNERKTNGEKKQQQPHAGAA